MPPLAASVKNKNRRIQRNRGKQRDVRLFLCFPLLLCTPMQFSGNVGP